MTATLPAAWEPKKATLFSLTEELVALDMALTESDGELTPEIEAQLQALTDQLDAKIDNVAWFIRTCEARAEAYSKAEAELRAKRYTEDTKVAHLKTYVRACMAMRNTRKLEGSFFTFAIQKNGGKPPVGLLNPDPQAFPAECQRVTVAVDREAVRGMIEAGTLPEGLAVIEPHGEHLRLR